MCGGYSVLKDVYKTTVYKLAKWRNSFRLKEAGSWKLEAESPIPERILTKAPSAELKPNQTDQDSLPPYDDLDAILEMLIERQMGVEEIVAATSYDKALVTRVSRLLYAAEYKRRQAPPGVKLTGMSFGRDRRYPMTNGWKG
jgi:NAD+ synthase